MFTILALLLGIAAAAAQPAPPPPPRICSGASATDLMAGRCIDAPEKQIDLGPADKARSWIWIDSAHKRIAIGTLAPDARQVVIEDEPSALLTIGGSAERGWPAATTVTMRSGKESWKFTLARDVVSSLRALTAPDGSYNIRLDAPRHLTLERRAQVFSRKKPAQLGRLELKPVPMLRGHFIDKEGNPVADVAVTTPEGVLLATSDPAGFVNEELRGPLPPRVFVRRSGYGHRSADVTRNDADFDLGTVTLSPGSTLTVNVDRNGYTGPLTASLIRPGEHTIGKRTTFESATVPDNESKIELRDVEAREYVLILRGQGPLEIIRDDVTVGERENATKDVRLDSRTVKAFVHQASTPLRETNVQLVGGNGEWNTNVKTDDEGRFRLDAWSEGGVGVRVQRSAESWYGTHRSIGKLDTEWNIDVPDRTIRGVVLDKKTSAPIASADVSLRVELPNRAGVMARSISVAPDGRFTVDFAEPAHYQFTARDADHVDTSVSFDLREDEREHEVRLEMERGHSVRVKVVNADGTPAANAFLTARRSMMDPMQSWKADGGGVATVTLPNDDPLPLWALVPAGPFTFATIFPDAEPEKNRVVLPPGNANIVVHTIHDDRSAAPHTHLFLAWNGALLPDDVRFGYGYERFVTGSDGLTMLTNVPAGEYDFWGEETPEEHVTVADPSRRGPATHASVLPGQNSVNVVVVKPKVGKK